MRYTAILVVALICASEIAAVSLRTRNNGKDLTINKLR